MVFPAKCFILAGNPSPSGTRALVNLRLLTTFVTIRLPGICGFTSLLELTLSACNMHGILLNCPIRPKQKHVSKKWVLFVQWPPAVLSILVPLQPLRKPPVRCTRPQVAAYTLLAPLGVRALESIRPFIPVKLLVSRPLSAQEWPTPRQNMPVVNSKLLLDP